MFHVGRGEHVGTCAAGDFIFEENAFATPVKAARRLPAA
jgi:hypothetical protein